MKININSWKKKQFFYKFMFIYRGILGKAFCFESALDDKDLQLVIEALNIKNRRKRIIFIYDKACELLDNSICKNKCGFKNGQCYVQRKLKNNKFNGCCRMCIYQSNNGCLTKNLTCKLFNCSEVKSRYKIYNFKDLKILKVLNLRQQVIVKADYFSSREEVLKDLYSYSIIYSTLRIVYRYMKNLVLYKKF